MKHRSPEVQRVVDQTERLQGAFRSEGFTTEVITNPLKEALGVILRQAFDPNQITYAKGLDEVLKSDPYDFDAVQALRHTLPISGPKLHPRYFLDIVDLAARTAAGTSGVSDGLATNLKSPPRGDDWFTEKGRGLGLHADFVVIGNNGIERDVPLHGLNIHATRWGVAEARFGIVRSLEYDPVLYEAQGEAGLKGDRSIQDAVYERLAAPFTDPIQLNPGDILLFQAQQHNDRGIAAVAHDFATLSETRRSDVFSPTLGDTAMVQTQRNDLAALHQLGTWGYGL